MSSISIWIMSIVGCICLTSLIDILLQDGETKKFVKGIASLIIFSAILSPIPALFNNNSTLDVDAFLLTNNNLNSVQNNEFLMEIKQKEYENQKNKCLEDLEHKGIKNANIEVIIDYNEDIQISKVLIDIRNIVISPDCMNIDIVKEIKECIIRHFLVEECLIEVIY